MRKEFTFFAQKKSLTLGGGPPSVMGVLNVTPDSFSDGGRYTNVETAVAHALDMSRQGAVVIDIGGESTRPGAAVVSADEEIRRVVPVIEALRPQTDVLISVDTSKASVAKAAIAAGADIINDVSGFRFDDGMAAVAASTNAGCILMHTPARPAEMDEHAVYDDVVETVKRALADSVERAQSAGVAQQCIMLDPGFGFGKTPEQNYELLRRLPELAELGFPLLVGVSRKRMVRHLAGSNEELIAHANSAFHAVATMRGASVLRVHDVAHALVSSQVGAHFMGT